MCECCGGDCRLTTTSYIELNEELDTAAKIYLKNKVWSKELVFDTEIFKSLNQGCEKDRQVKTD